MSTMIRFKIVPRISFSALQHFRIQKPFFSLRGSLEAAWNRCPDSKESHPRVWLPSRWDGLALEPWEVSFNPQRSWASLFKAFLLPGDRKTLSSLPLRSYASDGNLSTSISRFSGFLPPRKPCPFLPPKCLAQVGTSCSLELFDLSGSPSTKCKLEALSFELSPLSLMNPQPYDKKSTETQGLLLGSLALSPYGRRPVWPSRS